MTHELPIRQPAVVPSEVLHLDAAIERCSRIESIDALRSGGRTHVRVVNRQALLRETLGVVSAFVEERLRQAEQQMRGILERREQEATEEGRFRVLNSVADLGDLLDSLIDRMTDEQLALAAKALDRRLDRIFKNFEFERIPTVGEPFDPALHEIIDELAGTGQPSRTICKELRRGYRRGSFVLRVARVVVTA